MGINIQKGSLMNDSNFITEVKLNEHINGYKVKQILQLDEINSVFYLLIHQKTGAQHIHIENEDSENTFAVSFKTVPFNSTGVAHILEHTVLCGSKNFPVRDPFFSMLKRSLSTFMNAFTASDWTMYPFSTQNKKDYYNLAKVYMDSVFFPIIDEISFKQEGCRLDFENHKKEDYLVYKGIVYNEMKGVMSSPSQIMTQSLLKSLYPDTTYSNNSGGDPAKIPFLTYDELKQFHKRYYHPSNAFFYTYGNFPLISHLQYINDNFLRYFDHIETNSSVISQPRWKKSKILHYYYPLHKAEDTDKKSQVCVAWLTVDVKNTFEVLILTILEQILLGNDGSPLRKALIDSRLGTSLSDGTGFDAENRDTMFSCGLKNVKESNAKQIETIIITTLESLIEKGINKSTINSVLHRIEFSRKERTNNPYPFGIKLLLGISSCWFHGGNTSSILQIDKDLDKIKKYISNGGFLEKKIEEYFIHNNHRILLILSPDQNMDKLENERVKKELFKIRLNMNKTDLNNLRLNNIKFNNLNSESEDVSCLPTLQLEDIPKQVNIVDSPFKILEKKYDVLAYNQPTSDIFYFSSLFGCGSIDKDILSLIPFFCYSFPRLGTTEKDYTKIAQSIDLYTGGLFLNTHSRTMLNNGVCLPFISFNSKCLIRNKTKMIKLIQEMVNKTDFNNEDRIIQLLLEYKSGLESMIVRNGHNFSISLSSRNFSDTNHLNEKWSGITQFHLIKDTLNNIARSNVTSLKDKLNYISKVIFSRNNFKIAVVGEKLNSLSIQNDISNFIDSIPINKKSSFKPINFDLNQKYICEGWATSTSVSFVAQTFNTVKMNHKDSPALSVISNIIRSMYLHKEVREKGGAYGAFSIYNPEDGLFSFCSYRDPNIVKTLNVYEKICDFIHSSKVKNEDIKEAIIQVCAKIDKPDTPSSSAKKDFLCRILNLSDKARQDYKTKLLKLNKKNVIEIARKYFAHNTFNVSTAIISNEKLLKEASKSLDNMNLVIKHI